MCGIAGFNWNNTSLADKMISVLLHRGPDNKSIYSNDLLTFAHSRLSIIDLSTKGNQPMTYQTKDRSAVIVFNGEIYNFKELRAILSEKGYSFNSASDTEVVLAMYLEFGYECVNHFNGMWSFSIYDLDKGILFCSRDRFGQKPFYYYNENNKFIFASEIKAIIQYSELEINKIEKIDTKAIDFYIDAGFIPAPYTIYHKIRKLKSGENLVFNLKTNQIDRKWTYYEIGDYKPLYNKSYLKEEMLESIRDSVRLRMIADVPVGAFLSGGLDSSLIVGIMKDFTKITDLHTFSIGFEGEKYDESKYIDIAKDFYGTQHHHYQFREKDFRELLYKYSYHYDEPFGDLAGFPTFVLSNLARKWVTVALSGDGGDEVFGGYTYLDKARKLDVVRKAPTFIRKSLLSVTSNKCLRKNTSISFIRDGLRASLRDKYEYPLDDFEFSKNKSETYKHWLKNNMEQCLRKSDDVLLEALRINDILYSTFGDHFLTKVDRASMANSIEVRSPLMDYRILNLSMKIPYKWKHGLVRNKLLMRKLAKQILPAKILNRDKQGFTPPIQEWIKDSFYSTLLYDSLDNLKLLNNNKLNFYLNKFTNGTISNQMKIRLFLLSQWFDCWMLN